MGRRRKSNKNLPTRMYQRRGKYYFVEPSGKWIPLGAQYAEAMAKYGKLTDTDTPCASMNDVMNQLSVARIA